MYNFTMISPWKVLPVALCLTSQLSVREAQGTEALEFFSL